MPKSFADGLLVGVATMGLASLVVIAFNSDRIIPGSNRVQEGYIAPSKIEVICRDIDTTDCLGLKETYIRVGTNTYPLKETDGKPTISEPVVSKESEKDYKIQW